MGRVQAAGGLGQHQLPLRRGRARATCSTTPTWWRSCSSGSSRPGSPACATSCRCCATPSSSRTAAAPTSPASTRSTSRTPWPPAHPSATSGPAPPTTATSSTPAAPRACPRASCGATKTSSSRSAAASTSSAARRSTGPRRWSRRASPAGPARPRCRSPRSCTAPRQWGVMAGSFVGNKIVLVSQVRRRTACGSSSAKRSVNMIMITGDAMGRPLDRDAAGAGRRVRPVLALRGGEHGGGVLAHGEGPVLRALAEHRRSPTPSAPRRAAPTGTRSCRRATPR